MSDLTACNYCKLKRLRRQAKLSQARIHIRQSKQHGGLNVFLVPHGGSLDSSEGSPFKVAWFKALPETCCCGRGA